MRVGSRITKLSWTVTQRELLANRIECRDCDHHFHDTYTLGLVRAGVVRLVLGQQRFLANEGDVFLIHPYEVHAGGDPNHSIQCDILYPSIDLIAQLTHVTLLDTAFPCFNTPIIGRDAATARLFCAVDAATRSRSSPETDAAIRDALGVMLTPRLAGMRRLKVNGPECPAVLRAFDTMLSRFDSINGSFELCSLLGVSPYHLIRQFHRAVGLPPSAFLRQLRVARARAQIAAGGNLADVAVSVGFVDQSHLTRAFKSVFGFPPGVLARTVRTRSGSPPCRLHGPAVPPAF